MINARSETVLEKPALAESFRKHRVLVPADAILSELSSRYDLVEATLDDETLALARGFEADHAVP